MNPAEKSEIIRRHLALEAKTEGFEQGFVREIVFVAKIMGGWSIEHILKMPVLRYVAVREALKYQAEEERKQMEQSRGAKTFR